MWVQLALPLYEVIRMPALEPEALRETWTFPYWMCDLWHVRAPFCYSLLISEMLIYGPFQHYFPLSHSIVARLLVLMEIVKNPRKTIFMRKATPWCKPGRETKLSLSEQLRPGSF